MESFSKSYIEKCIKYREEIENLINRSRGLFANKSIELPKYYFQVGDCFHCLSLMSPQEVKEVINVSNNSISTGIPFEEYPIDECLFVPNENQLAAGLKACSLSMGEDAHGKGPERLLDRYIELINQSKETI